MKLRILFFFFLLSISLKFIHAQTDTTELLNKYNINDNGFKFMASIINGFGLGYEFEPFNRIYIEGGGSTWGRYTNRLYIQSKFSLIKRKNNKLKMGIDLSYINTSVFQTYETFKISPLINYEIKRWGFLLAIREPYWVDYYDSFKAKMSKAKKYYFLFYATYNISLMLKENKIRKYKKMNNNL